MPRLVARHHEINRQLLEELQRAGGPGLDVQDLPPEEASWTLAEAETDVALVSPLFFGKRESDVALLGGACVAAVGATGEWRLHFHGGLRSIGTVGYFGNGGIAVILAEILLKEKYGMSPRMQKLPMPDDTHSAQVLFDTLDAIVTTDDTQRAGLSAPGFIDLIDEWFDMTQLPLVREVFIGWESRLDVTIDAAVHAAGLAADAAALQHVEEKLQGRGVESELELLPAHFRYRFTEDVIEGLQTFFHLAFAHGLHRDIPDLVFWSEEESSDREGVRA